jgi:hypothetical protein
MAAPNNINFGIVEIIIGSFSKDPHRHFENVKYILQFHLIDTFFFIKLIDQK